MPQDLQVKISVVLPTYNRAHKLAPVVASVAAQSYNHLELIIVDDASTDDTVATVERLARDHPALPLRLVRLDRNSGGGAARNRGVREATGSLIAFLDSDDLWFPDKLRLQVEAWHNSPDPSRTVVYCLLVTHDGWRKEVRPRVPKAQETSVGDYLFVEGGFIQTSCLLLPTDLAREAPFDEDLRAHQDLQLVLSLEALGAEFRCVEQVLVSYSTAAELGRVSSNRDPRPSEVFLDRYGTRLSHRARLGFAGRLLALRYGKAGRPLKGASLLWRALGVGAISSRDFAWLLTRTMVPEPLEMFIRRTIRGLFGSPRTGSPLIHE